MCCFSFKKKKKVTQEKEPREVQLKATEDFSLAMKWNGVCSDFEIALDR